MLQWLDANRREAVLLAFGIVLTILCFDLILETRQSQVMLRSMDWHLYMMSKDIKWPTE